MSIDTTAGAAQTPPLTALVAEEIRALMGRRRVNQSQLARLLGHNDQWLSIRLRGIQPIDVNDLQRIAEVLGVEPGTLIPRIEPVLDPNRGRRHPMSTKSMRPERSRPSGHPKRTTPHVTPHRPVRNAAAIKALTGREADVSAQVEE